MVVQLCMLDIENNWKKSVYWGR